MKLPFSFSFERIFKKIIQEKGGVMTLCAVCLLSFMLVIFFNKEKNQFLKKNLEEALLMRSRIEHFLAAQKDRTTFFKKYGGNIDRYYIGRVLEGAQFLKRETETLRGVCEHPAFKSCNNIKQRWNFLTKGENNLVFIEESRKCKNSIEEIALKQKHPVEVDNEDVKQILSLVEGVAIGEYCPPPAAPQMIFRRFTLKKRKFAEGETFLLEMHITKREVIQ